jgi:hypothetical protein
MHNQAMAPQRSMLVQSATTHAQEEQRRIDAKKLIDSNRASMVQSRRSSCGLSLGWQPYAPVAINSRRPRRLFTHAGILLAALSPSLTRIAGGVKMARGRSEMW